MPDQTQSQAASKRSARRARAKENKKQLKEQEEEMRKKFSEEKTTTSETDGMNTDQNQTVKEESTEVIVEEIPLAEVMNNPALQQFKDVFERFQTLGKSKEELEEANQQTEESTHPVSGQNGDAFADASHEEEMTEEDKLFASGRSGLSRRKQKELDRLAIAELKKTVERPDVVELHDANSKDPKLLVYLKAYKNTVPVPSHWCHKSKYLQRKRGFEKGPWELPSFIQDTGISKIRGAQQEKEAEMKSKAKQRGRVQPKLGKIDIDYQILHDAFFRYQTKPKMTQHGSLYYEGREFEMEMSEKKPLMYSAQLREALGMKDENSPPPWLFAMQRYGPPPAYPGLPVPGVSAPIPSGARYGFGEGEWGKAPVDEFGNPLFGNVFGAEKKDEEEEQIDRSLWGELESEDEDEEEYQEEVEEQEEDQAGEEQANEDGTISGIASVSTFGTETPHSIQLRKALDGTSTETPGQPRSLYTVLEEKSTSVDKDSMFGTSHTYVFPGSGSAEENEIVEQQRRVEAKKRDMRGQVDINLTPEELSALDDATLMKKYEKELNVANAALKPNVDLDDEDDLDSQKKKRRKTGSDKAYKDFKF